MFTVSADHFAGFAEEKDSVGRGNVELETLGSVLDKLGEKFQDGSRNLRRSEENKYVANKLIGGKSPNKHRALSAKKLVCFKNNNKNIVM